MQGNDTVEHVVAAVLFPFSFQRFVRAVGKTGDDFPVTSVFFFSSALYFFSWRGNAFPAQSVDVSTMDKNLHPAEQTCPNCCACCRVGTTGPWFGLRRNVDGSYLVLRDQKLLIQVDDSVFDNYAPRICNECLKKHESTRSTDRSTHPSKQIGPNCCICCRVDTTGPWFDLKKNDRGEYFFLPNITCLLPVSDFVYDSFAPYICNECKNKQYELVRKALQDQKRSVLEPRAENAIRSTGVVINCCACLNPTACHLVKLVRVDYGSYIYEYSKAAFLLDVDDVVYNTSPYVCTVCEGKNTTARRRKARNEKRLSSTAQRPSTTPTSLFSIATSSAPTKPDIVSTAPSASSSVDLRAQDLSVETLPIEHSILPPKQMNPNCCVCCLVDARGPRFQLRKISDDSYFFLPNHALLLQVNTFVYDTCAPFICQACMDKHDEVKKNALTAQSKASPCATDGKDVNPADVVINCCACRNATVRPWFKLVKSSEGDDVYDLVRWNTERFLLSVDSVTYSHCPYVCAVCVDENVKARKKDRNRKRASTSPQLSQTPTEAANVASTSAQTTPIERLGMPADERVGSLPANRSLSAAAEMSDLVKTFVSIGEARSRTRTMIAAIQTFLSLRAKVTEAIAPITTDVLDVENFMDMQDAFIQMLHAQLEAIKNDHRLCADKMALANGKQS